MPELIDATDPLDALTPRELEVLALLAEGLSNQAIAERLVVTKRAVEKHIKGIFGKLPFDESSEHDRRVLATRRVPRLPLAMDEPAGVDEYRSVAEFRAALRRFQRRTEKIAQSAGLTPRRYVLLLMIKGAPAGTERATVTDLAKRLQLAQPTVTDLVSRAEAAGLVRREPSTTDRRVTHICLTSDGERRLASAFTRLEKERENLVDALVQGSAR